MAFFARNNTNSTLSAGNGPNLKVTLIKGGVEELAFDASMPQGPITVGKVLVGDNPSHIIVASFTDIYVHKETCAIQYNEQDHTVTFNLTPVANGVNYPHWFKDGVKIDTSVECNRTFTICMVSMVKQKISGPKNQDVSIEYEITYPDFTQEFCPSSPEEEVNQPEASPAKGVVDEPKASPAKGAVNENVRPEASPAQEDSDDENIVRKKKSDKRKIISDDEDEVVEVPEPSDADTKKLVDAVNKALERIKKEIKEHNTTIKNPDFKCMKQNHTIYFLLNKDTEEIANKTADEDDELDKKKFLFTLYKKLAEEYPKMAEKISKIRQQNNAKYPRKKMKA
jgi:hypothetical protein